MEQIEIIQGGWHMQHTLEGLDTGLLEFRARINAFLRSHPGAKVVTVTHRVIHTHRHDLACIIQYPTPK